MRNIKVQDKHGACAIFCLANLLQDISILSYRHDEKYIPSGRIELSEILKKEGLDNAIEPICITASSFGKIPPVFVESLINGYVVEILSNDSFNDEEEGIPFFVIGQKGNSFDTLHCSLLVYRDDRFLFSDPMSDGFVSFNSLKDIHSEFKYISQVWMLTDGGDGKCAINLNKIWEE